MSASPRSLAEWLREAWADPAAGCPPPAAWLAEEQAALTAEQRERLRAHLAGCPACRAESELAAAFDAGEGAGGADLDWVVSRLREPGAPAGAAQAPPARPEPAGNRPPAPVVRLADRRWARRVPWTRLAAAAAVVLGIGLAIQSLYVPAPPAPPIGGIVRGGSIAQLAPAGEVADLPAALRWEGVAGAASYRVRLEAPTGAALWEAEVPGGVDGMTVDIDIPEATRANMLRAVTYRWTVEALDAAGGVLARSDATAFRARPQPEPPAAPEADSENGDFQP